MTLKLYDTLTRQKRDFVPIDPANVRLYVCGPTVYDFAHIGNARPVIVFDVLFRLLRHLAKQGVWDGGKGETKVTYVRNITDVDDKINERAARDFPGLPLNEAIREVTTATGEQFHKDIAALGALPPTQEPRATEHIAEMRAIIEKLVQGGFAYVAGNHVLFSPTAMDAAPSNTLPRYGALANRSLNEMIAGARVDVAPYKRAPTDFVLWKPSKPGEPSWPSPAGIAVEGRPGWHIECSAMADKWLWEEAKATLGESGLAHPHQFDIHGGGIDLVFPHHENEVAQSTCAFGQAGMANYWMHNGFLQVEGQKMSKSLGNFVTIDELLQQRPNDPSWGEIIRLNMLRTHYRQPIDWTEKGLLESQTIYQVLRRSAQRVTDTKVLPSEAMIDALCEDLNTPKALAEVQSLARRARSADIRESPRDAANQLVGSLIFLGFRHAVEHIQHQEGARTGIAQAVETKIAARNAARAAKDWAEADRIRKELDAMGIAVKDNKDGTSTWEVKR